MLEYNITTRGKDGGRQYIVSYKDENGEWKQKSKQGFKKDGDAKAAARERVKEIEKEVESKKKISEEYKGKTFAEFRDMYIRHYALGNDEGNTLASIETSFEAFKALNDKSMSEITSLDVQECVDFMFEKKLEKSSIRLYLANIKTAFDYAVDPLGMITNNPAKKIRVKKDKRRKEKRALTVGERDDLLSKIKNRTYYIISLIAAMCGLRIGEIIGLLRNDIDFKNHVIHVHQQWKRKKARYKNGKYVYIYGLGTLKRPNSYRDVPMSKEMEKELKQYMAETPINIDGRLFDYINTAGVCGNLSDAYKSLGYDISIHNLRHTYISILIANNIDFKTVATFAGDDIITIQKTYTHQNKDAIKNAMDLIDKIM